VKHIGIYVAHMFFLSPAKARRQKARVETELVEPA
jgi:hypothetical protein